jgi:hypothetical protein
VPVSTIDPDVVAQADRILERHIDARRLRRDEQRFRGPSIHCAWIDDGPPEPAPMKADSFEEWERKTAALLKEYEKQKR